MLHRRPWLGERPPARMRALGTLLAPLARSAAVVSDLPTLSPSRSYISRRKSPRRASSHVRVREARVARSGGPWRGAWPRKRPSGRMRRVEEMGMHACVEIRPALSQRTRDASGVRVWSGRGGPRPLPRARRAGWGRSPRARRGGGGEEGGCRVRAERRRGEKGNEAAMCECRNLRSQKRAKSSRDVCGGAGGQPMGCDLQRRAMVRGRAGGGGGRGRGGGDRGEKRTGGEGSRSRLPADLGATVTRVFVFPVLFDSPIRVRAET